MWPSNTEHVCMHPLRQFWRRKYYAGITLIAIATVAFIIWLSMQVPDALPNQDGYLDDVPKDVYEQGVAWYNGRTLSPGTPEWSNYLTELRRDWIIWKHDANWSYKLDNPEIEDQSMGQAQVIRKIFKDKRNGFFVECGAYDGETRSNTLVLERSLGWTGLLVEADPNNFSKMLLKNRKAYLTPTCLGIHKYPSVNSFLMAKNVGRLHEPNANDSHLPNSADVAHSGTHVSVQCFPFIDYMIALNVSTVNYFSLDVEGNELQVLKTIPFDKINIETLSVEFSHVEAGRDELVDFMKSNGYRVYTSVVRKDKLAHDIIFVKEDLRVS
ncbi:uncharacterized protein LOC116425123 isoform X2 [Nomia melanderi]|uniref:uncharacterized protein LOC116425123 isoform X2 n=1 Tax=Nomia melanderi TaxID=2448451 RepID=UPI003FCC72C6